MDEGSAVIHFLKVFGAQKAEYGRAIHLNLTTVHATTTP